ncbi:MAG: succinate dehydrogenase assembly factor 2 [Rhodobiaceae bacterium]|nr:succinate dehydrogenase assembly factor 2 [Rhodobiaceae bacterium]
MTGTEISSDGLSARRRRILFRAWHRGTREMDILFGRFVDAFLTELDDAQLDTVEALIEEPDSMLFSWISGSTAVPPGMDTPVLRAMIALHHDGPDKAGAILRS